MWSTESTTVEIGQYWTWLNFINWWKKSLFANTLLPTQWQNRLRRLLQEQLPNSEHQHEAIARLWHLLRRADQQGRHWSVELQWTWSGRVLRLGFGASIRRNAKEHWRSEQLRWGMWERVRVHLSFILITTKISILIYALFCSPISTFLAHFLQQGAVRSRMNAAAIIVIIITIIRCLFFFYLADQQNLFATLVLLLQQINDLYFLRHSTSNHQNTKRLFI